ncbi:MAG: helix-turn-helix domain-containing protein [Planctomycetes bacterium]|nr:helix-turn-helix domain-containing protein [Planctomycetota bacterium]
MSQRWTIEELREVTARVLDAADYQGQASRRVQETPDKRTIRYYTTLGLVDRPVEFRGRTAYYGRRHVLQLAAIKRLQAKGMSLVEIQESLSGADDRRLTRWAGVPREFWDELRSEPAASPDPDALLANESPAPVRSASFWRQAPDVSKAAPVGAPLSRPRTMIALSLAEGVTLLLEDASPSELEEARLAELAPAVDTLVRELRRLKLVP